MTVRPNAALVRAVLAMAPAGLAIASLALAHHVDPRRATTVVIGPCRGASPMARVDPLRTGRAHEPLPKNPRVRWRHPLRGGFDLLPLAVDERGATGLASGTLPQLLQLGPDGTEEWRYGTGSALSSGPVLLSDGTRAVVTATGEVFGVSPSGALRFRTDLASNTRGGRVAPLPLENGGVVVALGAEVVELDGDGAVRARSALGERAIGPVLRTTTGFLATGESGGIYRIQPPDAPERLGTFKGDPGPGAAAADERTLLAIVDHRRLMAFDLITATTSQRFGAGVASLDGPVAVGPHGVALFTTFSGALVGIDPSGAEVRRTSLERSTRDGGANPATVAESPPLLTDDEGSVAFARVSGAVGVVSPQGSVELVDGVACSMPVALAPAGPREFVVACRDGNVLLIGD